ncbi:GFA family protein [Halomonas sp. M4R1S46]|uniref:GFA family protein n=1 Tax=Halomonas sp. M4R1S46 TaxID=2982692 RepID=UPI0021E3EA1B|nr:GFA family protein [Halomonas sp. M4R1S46]UYG06637.1 GFA family protein [Halomonas sp. M4R1S46]
MHDAMTLRGSCLCGAVTLAVEAARQNIGACHCRMCRTWGGGPLLALESVSRVEIEGENSVSVFASSDWAERAFCRHCGTHLFYRLRTGEHYAVPAGLVDDGEAWTFDTQIFIDEKPPWYHFANATRDLTGREVFEAFEARKD